MEWTPSGDSRRHVSRGGVCSASFGSLGNYLEKGCLGLHQVLSHQRGAPLPQHGGEKKQTREKEGSAGRPGGTGCGAAASAAPGAATRPPHRLRVLRGHPGPRRPWGGGPEPGRPPPPAQRRTYPEEDRSWSGGAGSPGPGLMTGRSVAGEARQEDRAQVCHRQGPCSAEPGQAPHLLGSFSHPQRGDP